MLCLKILPYKAYK